MGEVNDVLKQLVRSEINERVETSANPAEARSMLSLLRSIDSKLTIITILLVASAIATFILAIVR